VDHLTGFDTPRDDAAFEMSDDLLPFESEPPASVFEWDPGATIWTAEPDPMKKLKEREKFPDENRLYRFAFGAFAELQATPAAVLDAPIVTSTLPDLSADDAALTIGGPLVVDSDVVVMLGGGTVGVVYLVKCTVQTDGLATLVVYGKLRILSPTSL
jgi:hypothetical protein